jgi:apolipoprotein N-acyltransferase
LPCPRLLPALVTALLLSLCHFTLIPFVSGWFAWVALVPLLCLVRSAARPWQVYLSAWAAGLVFFFFVLQWMRVAHPLMYFTWAMLAVWCSLFIPLGIFLVRRLDRRTRLPLVVTVPVVWTGLEFIRAHLLTGFAWYFLGHTQHDFLPAIQIADLGGAYAVTFVVAAVNALVFEFLFTRREFRTWMVQREPVVPRRPGMVIQAVAVYLLVSATLAYGYWRLGEHSFQQGPHLALVQGNVPQAVRNQRHDGEDSEKLVAAEQIADAYLGLHDIAERGKPDLIIWPETSYYRDWVEPSREAIDDALKQMQGHFAAQGKGVRPPSYEQLRQLWLDKLNPIVLSEVKTWPTAVLLGLNSDEMQLKGSPKHLNSAILLEPGCKYMGRYDKIHRVPWGEYVPLRDWIPSMDAFAPYDHDYSIAPGDQLTRFPLGGRSFGVVICFEDSDPYLSRQFLKRPEDHAPLDRLTRLVGGGMYDHLPLAPPSDKPVDFLVNTSNDGWFPGTTEHEEHLAICRFRAVECRRSVVRAVNMGISAVIDGNGRVLAPGATHWTKENIPVWEIEDGAAELSTARWAEFKKVAGVLVANVPIDSRSSIYVRWGDWLPAACWLVIGCCLLRPRRSRQMA